MNSPKRLWSFCESSSAGPRSPWHIRKLTENGMKLGGGIDSPSLCGKVEHGWDLDIPINAHHLSNNTCHDCRMEYIKKEA